MTYSLCIVAHNILIRKALLVEQLAIDHYTGHSNLSLLGKRKKRGSFGLGEQSCLNFDNTNAFWFVTSRKQSREYPAFSGVNAMEARAAKSQGRNLRKKKHDIFPSQSSLWLCMTWLTERSLIKRKNHRKNVRKLFPAGKLWSFVATKHWPRLFAGLHLLKMAAL